MFIVAVLLPWLSLIAKLEVLKKLLNLFDELMNPPIIEKRKKKKTGLFS